MRSRTQAAPQLSCIYFAYSRGQKWNSDPVNGLSIMKIWFIMPLSILVVCLFVISLHYLLIIHFLRTREGHSNPVISIGLEMCISESAFSVRFLHWLRLGWVYTTFLIISNIVGWGPWCWGVLGWQCMRAGRDLQSSCGAARVMD